MTSLTRAEALAQARRDFGSYIESMLGSNLVPRSYVAEIGRHWDRRLAALARIGPQFPVATEVLDALRVLSREVRTPDLDPDASVRWLDTFPDRVADLFPPSAVTFHLLDEEEQAEAEAVAYPTVAIGSAA